MRIARDAPIGFKTLVDIADRKKVVLPTGYDCAPTLDDLILLYGADPSKMLDVMTLAIPSRHRGMRSPDILGAMYHQILDYSFRNSIKHWTMMFDDEALAMTRQIGVPLHPINGLPPVEYLGSTNTHALISVVDSIVPSMQVYSTKINEQIAAGARLRAALKLCDGMMNGTNFKGELQLLRS